jgi:site-specific DNA-methyltransferase (adenine-specific)
MQRIIHRINVESVPTPASTRRAPANRTLTILPHERDALLQQTLTLTGPVTADTITGRVIHQDILACVAYLPDAFIDLLIVDPPYNLRKVFAGTTFRQTTAVQYEQWLEQWLLPLLRCLKPDATVYVCCDWSSSSAVHAVLQRHFIVRNRITWEREKGRGARANWKNCAEDIWFCTRSQHYWFDVEAVKLRKRVIAPYRDASGAPRDWHQTDDGNFRLTSPSNLWTDLSVPFWSMPENTDHPTQKPEKLFARLILASSRQGDFVFDPFLGSGTTCVVAHKLGRRYSGVELAADYCCMAVKRLHQAEHTMAHTGPSIQGYQDGYFLERNARLTLDQSSAQRRTPATPPATPENPPAEAMCTADVPRSPDG